MTICYFGDYQAESGRTQVLRMAIEAAGIKIIECHSKERGIHFFIDLYKKHRVLRGSYDILFIGNSGPSNFLPLFAQMITRKPIVWEPLFSIYDNYVFDRKVAPRYSLKALYYFLMDYISSHCADRIVLDTENNCRYFEESFHIKKGVCGVVHTGANTATFRPVPASRTGTRFEIEFHGKYIPVHGTEVMVRAAKILMDDPDIHFTMIGKGQMHDETVALAQEIGVTNMDFLPFMPQSEVIQYIANADATIGLLGDVPRIARAIPGKLYETAAMGKVSINADTPALREIFTPGVDVIGVRQGDPEDLARAIREVKKEGTARAMGEAAQKTFESRVSLACLSAEIRGILDSVS